MKVPAILKNKYVCYALMALASLNVIGYLTVKAWECLALFTLTAYGAHCYCKNVSCAILAALFVANFVFGCGRVKEGFTDALKGGDAHVGDAQESLVKAIESFTANRDECKKSETDMSNKVEGDFTDDTAEKAKEKAGQCVTALAACTEAKDCTGGNWEQSPTPPTPPTPPT